MSLAYRQISDLLASGSRPVILDGGTGTDIQRRGAPMSGETWCAEANLTHPEIVAAVHREYIDVGADAITANTFATSALLFNHLGRDADVARIDGIAVEIAKRAADGRVPVAGSFSTMRPVLAGSDRTVKQREWPEAEARRLFAAKAEGLAKAGADFIMMEMMRDSDYSVWATEAAVDTGLPVWIGISVELNAAGELTGFGREDMRLADIIAPLMAAGPDVISIMHSSPNNTTTALPVLREQWDGAMGAYPECGYFAMPEWKFVEVIPVPAFVEVARIWNEQGVTVLGGCCGIGPDHIRALAEAFKGAGDA